MYTVIGIGGIGVDVAKNFNNFPQYNLICVDDEKHNVADQHTITKQKKPELYEEAFKTLKPALKKKVKDKVICVLSGASAVSSISLKLLYGLRDKEISILYIKPEVDLLSDQKRMQDKVVFSILQEYTRSGLFQDMFLISSESMDALVEDASISDYYTSMNEMIVNAFHMIKVFDNQKPAASNLSEVLESRRIYSLGLLEQKSGDEKLFFPIDTPLDKRLYFGITEENINNDKNLQRNIIKLIKDKNEEFCKYSYGVYKTQYDSDFCYMKIYTSKVQDF